MPIIPERDKLVLKLRYEDGLTFEMIADHIQSSTTTVRRILKLYPDKKPKSKKLSTSKKTVDKKINPEGKIRNCLKCQDEFLSTWAGNRVCDKCRQVNNTIHTKPETSPGFGPKNLSD